MILIQKAKLRDVPNGMKYVLLENKNKLPYIGKEYDVTIIIIGRKKDDTKN